MRLSSYLNKHLNKFFRCNLDGHRHVFSHRGPDHCMVCGSTVVGFLDVELDSLQYYKDIPGLYDEWIERPPIQVQHLLATGLNINEIREIYKRHPDKIDGFGELKLYSTFAGEPVDYKHIEFAEQVCEFSREVGCRPVYVHYEICEPEHADAFESLIQKFPDIPIVLCHLGMNQDNPEFAWPIVKEWKRYSNLWFDTSWDAAYWLKDNLRALAELPADRLIWGSDTSPRLYESDDPTYKISDLCTWGSLIVPFFDQKTNLENLFALKP